MELSCRLITDDVTDSVDVSQFLTLTVAVVDDTDPYSSSNSCLLGMLLTYEDYQMLRTCHDINDVLEQLIDVEGDVLHGVVDTMSVDTSDVEVVVTEQHSPY